MPANDLSAPPELSIYRLMQELQHVPDIREHFLDAEGNLTDVAIDYRRRMLAALTRPFRYTAVPEMLSRHAPYWNMFLTTEQERIAMLVDERLRATGKESLASGVFWKPNPELVDFARNAILQNTSGILEPFRADRAADLPHWLAEYEGAVELARRAGYRSMESAGVILSVLPDNNSERERYLFARSLALGEFSSLMEKYGLQIEEAGFEIGRQIIRFRGRVILYDDKSSDLDWTGKFRKKPHPLDVIFMLEAMREECGLEALRDKDLEFVTYQGFCLVRHNDRFEE